MQNQLDDVIKVLAQVRSEANSHREHLIKNESATRTTLVDPVLRSLGWEIANPSMVVVEAPVRRGTTSLYADYGLRDRDAVKIVVEAKSLGQVLNLHRSQVVDYAFAFKINSVFLTNGIVWEHYTSLNPKHFEPTQVLDLAGDDLSQIATYLIQELGRIATNQNEHVLDSLYETLNELMMAAENVVDRISILEIEPTTIHPTLLSLKKRIATLEETLDSILPRTSNAQNQLTEESSPLIKEVKKLMAGRDVYQETATNLLKELIENADTESLQSPFWPRGANALSMYLNKVAPNLRALGIATLTGIPASRGTKRLIRLKRI